MGGLYRFVTSLAAGWRQFAQIGWRWSAVVGPRNGGFARTAGGDEGPTRHATEPT